MAKSLGEGLGWRFVYLDSCSRHLRSTGPGTLWWSR